MCKSERLKTKESADPSENLSESFCSFVDAQSTLDGLRVNQSGKLIGMKNLGHFAEETRLTWNPTVPNFKEND